MAIGFRPDSAIHDARMGRAALRERKKNGDFAAHGSYCKRIDIASGPIPWSPQCARGRKRSAQIDVPGGTQVVTSLIPNEQSLRDYREVVLEFTLFPMKCMFNVRIAGSTSRPVPTSHAVVSSVSTQRYSTISTQRYMFPSGIQILRTHPKAAHADIKGNVLPVLTVQYKES